MRSFRPQITWSIWAGLVWGISAGSCLAESAAFKTAADGGPRRFEVTTASITLLKSTSLEENIIAHLKHGAVLNNLGCDAEWCSVRLFRGGAKGFVLAKALRPATGPNGAVVIGKNTSKARARRKDFDATGIVACAQERGQPMGSCNAAVARSDGGDATVVVTFSTGFARQLYFVHGEFVAASATMSGTGKDVDWQLDKDLHRLRVDDQRFDLPHDLIFLK